MEKQITIDLKETTQHGDFIFPLVVYRPFLGGATKSLDLHWHSHMEISYVKTGKAVYTINCIDYHVKEGDIIIIPPECLHSGLSIENTYSENITIVFDVSMLISSTTDMSTTKFILPLLYHQSNFIHHIPQANERHPDLVECISSISNMFFNKKQGYELFIKSELLRMFYIFVNSSINLKNGAKILTNEDISKIKNVISFIVKNYNKKLYIKDMAKITNYSVGYFTKIFKKATNVTCIEYINKVRISQSAEMILNSNKSYTEIALETGFFNVSYFFREFRKMYGMTPKNFKKEYEKKCR